MGVISYGREVTGRLFRIAQVGQKSYVGAIAGVSRDRVGKPNASVERADHDRLPTAAGQTCDRQPFGISVFVLQQNVDAALHRQVKRGHAAGAAQVQLVLPVVLIVIGSQLP